MSYAKQAESLAAKRERVQGENEQAARDAARKHPVILEAQALFGGELGKIELAKKRRRRRDTLMQLLQRDAEGSPDPVSQLVYELSKLPGIGEKTATRLAYYILKQDVSYARSLADALLNAKQRIHTCAKCYTFTDAETCRICESFGSRSHDDLCGGTPLGRSIEQSGAFKGIYHVLRLPLSSRWRGTG